MHLFTIDNLEIKIKHDKLHIGEQPSRIWSTTDIQMIQTKLKDPIAQKKIAELDSYVKNNQASKPNINSDCLRLLIRILCYRLIFLPIDSTIDEIISFLEGKSSELIPVKDNDLDRSSAMEDVYNKFMNCGKEMLTLPLTPKP